MDVVVDASSVASWLLPDEDGAALDQVLAQRPRLFAPFLFWSEIRNTVIIQERRQRLSSQGADKGIEILTGLRITFDRNPESSNVIDLARKHRITVYDSMYLELALRLNTPLLSADQALQRASRAEGVILM